MPQDDDLSNRLRDIERDVGTLQQGHAVTEYRLRITEERMGDFADAKDFAAFRAMVERWHEQYEADRTRLDGIRAALDIEKEKRAERHRDADRRADVLKVLFPVVWGTVGTALLVLLGWLLGLDIPGV